MSFCDVHWWSEVGIFRGIGSVNDTSAPPEKVCGRPERWNEGPGGVRIECRRAHAGRDKLVLHGVNRRLLLLVLLGPGRVAWIDQWCLGSRWCRVQVQLRLCKHICLGRCHWCLN